MILQQNTFETLWQKDKLLNMTEQFLHLSQFIQLYSIIISRRAEARDFYF